MHAITCWIVLVILCTTLPTHAQQTMAVTGDRLSPFVLPIEPLDADVSIEALRAAGWTVDDTQRLLLQDDVVIRIGRHAFHAEQAAVWINRLPTEAGLVTQIALYFDDVTDPTERAGMGVSGREVLVTASVRGEVTMSAARLDRQRPVRRGILARGERRLTAYLASLLENPPPLQQRPAIQPAPPAEEFQPTVGGDISPREVAPPVEIELPETSPAPPWLRSPSGTLRFSAQQVEFFPGEQEHVVTAIGSIVVEYEANAPVDDFSQVTLSAERAVIFTAPIPLDELSGRQFSATDVRGVYLEGDVMASANRGEYTIRAPRVYYDFESGRAIMLDAVLRTYDRQTNIPIVARARELRQVEENQWLGREVRVSTSEFFVPHLSIGADQVTVRRRPSAVRPEQRETFVDSQGNTVRVGNVPVLGWPRFRGTLRDFPVRELRLGSRDNVGFSAEASWNLWGLLGREAPEGVETDLVLGGYAERGFGGGLNVRYDRGADLGDLEFFAVDDNGTDRTSAGREVEPDRSFRGIALWEHESQLSRTWIMQAQGSYISDETFISSWREDDFEERRELENSLYFRNQADNGQLSFLGTYAVNDFISNSYLLASRGYVTEKLPEARYVRYGDTLFNDQVTWSSEYSISRMSLAFDEHTARELGLRGGLFGGMLDDVTADTLRAAGLTSRHVSRYDMRHELSQSVNVGIFRVTSFVVGRVTGYDDAFEEFSSDAEDARWFGAAGLRVHTQFQYIDNSVYSRVFDLNRLRHIIEPSVMIWHGESNVSQADLPVYDEAVESAGTGSVARIGVDHTWQTQRGGPGRWRSVDVLTLRSALVLGGDDVDRESPHPQFFPYRPEYSQFGDHVFGEAVWNVSDSFAIVSQGTWDLNESVMTRFAGGAEIRHSPVLVSFIEYRSIDASDTELLGVGWDYQFTPKIRIALRPQWDFREDEFRSVLVRFTRSFPDFDLIVSVRRDEIRDDTTLSASMNLVEF